MEIIFYVAPELHDVFHAEETRLSSLVASLYALLEREIVKTVADTQKAYVAVSGTSSPLITFLLKQAVHLAEEKQQRKYYGGKEMISLLADAEEMQKNLDVVEIWKKLQAMMTESLVEEESPVEEMKYEHVVEVKSQHDVGAKQQCIGDEQVGKCHDGLVSAHIWETFVDT